MDNSKLQWPSDSLESFDPSEAKIVKQIVHIINMGDVEDPELMIAAPIWDWQQTEAGKWVMEHSNPTPTWSHHFSMNHYGHEYSIVAYLTPKQVTYFKLKFE
jgi:hypothetical protein